MERMTYQLQELSIPAWKEDNPLRQKAFCADLVTDLHENISFTSTGTYQTAERSARIEVVPSIEWHLSRATAYNSLEYNYHNLGDI